MRKEWVAWLLFVSLLLSGCGKTAQVPDEAQAAEEAVIQMETPTEEPAQASGISPIEPGQWAKYAEIYDAYFLGEDRRLPLDFMFARPILQMADLDQNGVPELIVYHGGRGDAEKSAFPPKRTVGQDGVSDLPMAPRAL